MNTALLTTVRITVGLFIMSITAIDLISYNTGQTSGQEITSNKDNTTTTDYVGPSLYNLTINGVSYPIKFNITGGILDTITIDGDQAILLVGISASTAGGKLTIELPRDLIDSKTDSNADKPYLVYEDDIDRSISFNESSITEQARTLVITFNSEDDLLEIEGTQVLSRPGGQF